MTRTQFLGLFAIPFLPKIDVDQEEQEGHVFNVKILKERLKFLLECPLKAGYIMIIQSTALPDHLLNKWPDSVAVQNIIPEGKYIRVFIKAADHYNDGSQSLIQQGQFLFDKNDKIYYVISTDKLKPFQHSMLVFTTDIQMYGNN